MRWRSSNRLLLAACLAAGLVAAGCSADPQEHMQAGVMGTNARVGDMLLRSVHVAAPDGHSYPAGADARVWFTLVNSATTPDTLTDGAQ